MVQVVGDHFNFRFANVGACENLAQGLQKMLAGNRFLDLTVAKSAFSHLFALVLFSNFRLATFRRFFALPH